MSFTVTEELKPLHVDVKLGIDIEAMPPVIGPNFGTTRYKAPPRGVRSIGDVADAEMGSGERLR